MELAVGAGARQIISGEAAVGRPAGDGVCQRLAAVEVGTRGGTGDIAETVVTRAVGKGKTGQRGKARRVVHAGNAGRQCLRGGAVAVGDGQGEIIADAGLHTFDRAVVRHIGIVAVAAVQMELAVGTGAREVISSKTCVGGTAGDGIG